MSNRHQEIFGQKMTAKTIKKAEKSKAKFIKKFGDDSNIDYPLTTQPNPILSPYFNLQDIEIGENGQPIDTEKGIIIGNIRMGFGHYRIAMAITSAAHALGYTPYWFDLNKYQETTGGKMIKHMNGLYSMGSRWSQKYKLFNKFYWEPLNSEGFRKLSYHAVDQKNAELMTPIFRHIPKDMPFVATHVWPSLAAVHSGVENVVNVIPDNWPMALHLSEGSIHTVQTPSSYIGYRTLRGMDKHITNQIPADQIVNTGQYIDHELVSNLEADTQKRMDRIENNKCKRLLLTIGGAGAQKEIFAAIITSMLPKIKNKEVSLFINLGDYMNVWDELCAAVPEMKELATTYFNNWEETEKFAEQALNSDVAGLHVFCHSDIFAAVYGSNLLMRASDIMITKPSELSFYPVPKLMIKRVGGHEAWGAIRAAEVGDGTYECEEVDSAVAMLNLMLDEKDILTQMNDAILKAKAIGTYDGAYNVIKLATRNK